MTSGVSKRGGRRRGAGRKLGSASDKRGERARVEAALGSAEALELFERARGGSFSAAKALGALFRASDRLGLLPLDRELAAERATRDFFWLQKRAARLHDDLSRARRRNPSAKRGARHKNNRHWRRRKTT